MGRGDGGAAVTETGGTRAGAATHIDDELDRVGYAVVPDVLTQDEIDEVRHTLDPHLDHGPRGRNPFEGYATQRVYCLVAKSRAFDRMILDPAVLDVTERALGPNFLLTATLAIDLHPGQAAQDFHYDDIFYRVPRPRPPISISTMWAIDEFTADNGATLIYPGSHRWGDDRPNPLPEVVTATMPAGSMLIYAGTLVHAGGANIADSCRLGISIQYCAAWGRQQENFMMAIGIDGARDLDPRLQELIGYSIHPPFMGMVDGRHPRKLLRSSG
jgi:ectoine hydroxylase-related dioxygenase (phytanoyl-CoA dioxygenase family)